MEDNFSMDGGLGGGFRMIQVHYIYCTLYFYFIYLFLAVLGFRCCVWVFSSCGGRGLLFVAVHRLLIVVASLVVEHRLQACGLQ